VAPTLPKPTFKTRLARVTPLLPDAIGPLSELINSDEPDPMQRIRNAVYVGGGDIGISAVAGGALLPPQLLQLSRFIYDAGEKDPESYLGKLQRGAEFFDPANYLRIASQALGQNTLKPTGADVDFAVENIMDGYKALDMDEARRMPFTLIKPYY